MNLFSSSSNDNDNINYPRKTAPVRLLKSVKLKEEHIFFTCMNCGNLINESIIEAHSNKCICISKEVTIINGNEVKTSNFKLEKLKEHLTELFKTNKNYYVNVIIIYIEELLSTNDQANNRSKIKKILKNINSLIKTYKGSFIIQIYLDRFQVLLHNRLIIYKNNQRNEPRESVSKKSSKSHNIEQISIINSINESISISSINNMTNKSGSDQNDDTESSNKEKIGHKDINQMNTKDMYQEFSQEVLNIKIEKFNHNSFVKRIQCKLLFVECIKQQIPYSEWFDFIMKEISQNCLKYTKRTRKINIKTMDTIHEEE